MTNEVIHGFDRVQPASSSTQRTDRVTFHNAGIPQTVPSTPGIRTFDDSDPNRYWSADNPWSSTKVAGSGTKITVLKEKKDEMSLRIQSGK